LIYRVTASFCIIFILSYITKDDEGKMGPFVNAVLNAYENDKEKIIQELELIFEKKP